jgi:exosortase C (VPDSG-CTERM-specific)
LKLKWPELPREYRTSAGCAFGFLVLALGALGTALALKFNGPALSRNDHLGLLTFSFLCFLICGAFFFLGRRWVAAAAFPVAFLLFMIPLPDAAVNALEWGSQKASAEAVNVYFKLAGLPFIRNEDVFWIPGMPLRVARECSGIRSSWVLLITSLIAAHLFLRSPWRRTIFVLLVIPLGILRNGFRILVLGWLCVHIDPSMIDSFIHHRGGPIFFVLSLVPLFLILWLLRRGENLQARKIPDAEPQSPGE